MAELTQGLFCPPPPSNIGCAGTPSKIGLIRLGGQEIGIHPLKPLWENSLVVKLDVSIGIASKCSQTSSPRNSTTKCSVRHTWKSWTTASKVTIRVKECLFYCWLASPYFSPASSLENKKALNSKVIPLWSSGWWMLQTRPKWTRPFVIRKMNINPSKYDIGSQNKTSLDWKQQ